MQMPKKTPPTAQVIRETRSRTGLSVPASAALVYVTRRTWHKYESGEVQMHPAFFELYRLKTGQF